ncbi:hypothetical protein MYX04_11630 [Nitrospiraceae bacterium AH_259_D15_M11_P09]|nr:hypothetical protein [Nitrospiraceae bacterium AH_259_D15_M11_P09]
MEYYGIPAICERMGWRTAKPLYHHKRRYSFPAFLRFAPRQGTRPKMYSNEQLILAWEVQQVRLERERVIARQEERGWQKQALLSRRR